MIERNEDGPLNSFIAQIVLKLLSSEVVFFSKEANQTIEFPLLDVMTIPHIFIKNLWKFRPDNLRMKKDIESHFAGITRKSNLIYVLWKPNFPMSTLNSTY